MNGRLVGSTLTRQVVNMHATSYLLQNKAAHRFSYGPSKLPTLKMKLLRPIILFVWHLSSKLA